MRDIEEERQRHRYREKQAPCREGARCGIPSGLASQLEPKADALSRKHFNV